MNKPTRLLLVAAVGATALAACTSGEQPQQRQANGQQQRLPAEPPRPSADALPEGTTPVAERVAVLGLLNKRTGQSRDLELRPGQAVRVDNVIVRLQNCETTAPHETQQLTGAFVQVDVADPQGQFGRVFSGWLYRESPGLNVVEHPIYDVWPRSCAMTHPGAAAPAAGEASSNRSSASNAASDRAAPRRPRREPAASPAPSPAPRARRAAPSNSADSIAR